LLLAKTKKNLTEKNQKKQRKNLAENKENPLLSVWAYPFAFVREQLKIRQQKT